MVEFDDCMGVELVAYFLMSLKSVVAIGEHAIWGEGELCLRMVYLRTGLHKSRATNYFYWGA
jgi:hypothetical protein